MLHVSSSRMMRVRSIGDRISICRYVVRSCDVSDGQECRGSCGESLDRTAGDGKYRDANEKTAEAMKRIAASPSEATLSNRKGMSVTKGEIIVAPTRASSPGPVQHPPWKPLRPSSSAPAFGRNSSTFGTQ